MKKEKPIKAVLANQFAGVGIFEVEFESQAEASPKWISEKMNVLDFDGQSAIDKVQTEIEEERKEKFRLVGVRLLARAEI